MPRDSSMRTALVAAESATASAPAAMSRLP
jgi:hypothetical protein